VPSAAAPLHRTVRRRARAARPLRFAPIGLLAFVCAGCAASPSTLSPHSDRASTLASLWWLMLIIGVAVYAIVVGLFVAAAVRPRRRASAAEAEAQLHAGGGRGSAAIIVVAGAIIPAIILVAVFAATVHAMTAFTGGGANPLPIQVIGRDWWWEVRYPESGIATANEIHIPVGQTVKIELTAGDVIHSFWVPELQAKQDAIPGQTNTLLLDAKQPGTYRGQCAEYCGLQHAHMALYVVAQAPAEYAAWVKQESAPPAPPTGAALQGQQAFLKATCAYCHAIQGTSAGGKTGPDLTHLASRGTIGAGVLPNTTANLAGWIVNPQTFKPGSNMPPSSLAPADLQAILTYLETLK
jgi:cytochrome c oxidase subunit 2